MRRGLPVLLLLALGCARGDAPPGGESDLWTVELWVDEALIVVGEPRPLVVRRGYDNQPAFLAGGDFVLYVERDADRTEIYRAGVADGKRDRLTTSPEREFSPLPMPGGGFSAIRVEPDGRQRLWRFTDQGVAERPIELPTLERIRYYAWLEDGTLALELDHDPPGLSIVRPGSARVEPLIERVGRAIQRVPGRHAVSFVHKPSETEWWIKIYDLDQRRIETVTRTLQGAEDHAWTPTGTLLQGSGTRIFRYIPGLTADWEPIADFRDAGFDEISRLTIADSGRLMVFVAEPR